MRSLQWTLYTNIKACFLSSKIATTFSYSVLIFKLTSQTYLEYLDQTAAACNYTNYVSTYVKYPPEGLLPLPGDSVDFADGCDVWTDIFNNALIINPAFNMYRIWDTASHDPCHRVTKN